jgi:hypothetical protein
MVTLQSSFGDQPFGLEVRFQADQNGVVGNPSDR